MAVKVVRLEGFKIGKHQVYFDSEFVRVGAGGIGVRLEAFLLGLDPARRPEALDALLQAGFRSQVYALLMCDRHVERPTLQETSDINSLEVKVNRFLKTADYVALVERLNVLLKSGVVRLGVGGALRIATRPGE